MGVEPHTFAKDHLLLWSTAKKFVVSLYFLVLSFPLEFSSSCTPISFALFIGLEFVVKTVYLLAIILASSPIPHQRKCSQYELSLSVRVVQSRVSSAAPISAIPPVPAHCNQEKTMQNFLKIWLWKKSSVFNSVFPASRPICISFSYLSFTVSFTGCLSWPCNQVL